MKRPTVLIADDEPHVRSGLRRRLSSAGFRVIEVPDGLGVLHECPKGQVDVILLDHGWPNGDGRSIARMIRNESDVPIVFVSGYDREDFRSIVTQLANVYYLSKPVEEHRLIALLASLTSTPRPAALAV
jgi:DNA-binding response OmpR family regulator